MNEVVATAAGAIVVAAVAAWFGYLFGARQEREREQRACRLLVAQELATPMRRFQELLRRHGLEEARPVDGDQVAEAFSNWSNAWDAHGHRLPPNWRNLSHSVLDATGTVFGSVARVHTRPDMAALSIGEPDIMWQQHADEYLEYATWCTLMWGDSDPEAPKNLKSYEEWLLTTGRRER